MLLFFGNVKGPMKFNFVKINVLANFHGVNSILDPVAFKCSRCQLLSKLKKTISQGMFILHVMSETY